MAVVVSLARYHKKRDFRKTLEPRPRAARKKSAAPIFVIQEHHARRLHFDFRIEAEGVLKSWAVPKEPSLDPSVKRLAVETEDHPMEYANFQGEIPKGQYGAGKVKIWDKGSYSNLMESRPVPFSVCRSIEKGHLELLLKGKRMKGRFALIRMGEAAGEGSHWLLMKMKPKPIGLSLQANMRPRRNERPLIPHKSPEKPKDKVKLPPDPSGIFYREEISKIARKGNRRRLMKPEAHRSKRSRKA